MISWMQNDFDDNYKNELNKSFIIQIRVSFFMKIRTVVFSQQPNIKSIQLILWHDSKNYKSNVCNVDYNKEAKICQAFKFETAIQFYTLKYQYLQQQTVLIVLHDFEKDHTIVSLRMDLSKCLVSMRYSVNQKQS